MWKLYEIQISVSIKTYWNTVRSFVFLCLCSLYRTKLTSCIRDHTDIKTKIPLAFYREWFADPWPILFRMMPEAQGVFWSGSQSFKEAPVTWTELEGSLSPSQSSGSHSWLHISITRGAFKKFPHVRPDPDHLNENCWNRGLGKWIFGKLTRCFWGTAEIENHVLENEVDSKKGVYGCALNCSAFRTLMST